MKLKCACGKEVELQAQPMNILGNSYKDLMLRTWCPECKSRLGKILGTDTSPGRPPLSNRDETIKRIRSLKVKMPTGDGAQQAPKSTSPRAMFS